MSHIQLVQGSCIEQSADVVVNAANRNLYAGGGICGVIFSKAGINQLTKECQKHSIPRKDGDAIITSACQMKNFKAIIHAVGPDFSITPTAFLKLFEAYYHSLEVLMNNNYHSISFPLISSGIFGGNLQDPAAESVKQCCRAYLKFTKDHPDYDIDVLLCAYTNAEMQSASMMFHQYF